MQIRTMLDDSPVNFKKLLRATLCSGIFIFACAACAEYFFSIALDAHAILFGLAAVLVNLKLIAEISRRVLFGVIGPKTLVCLFAVKLGLFLALISILAHLSPGGLGCFLCGFFSFVPGALLAAKSTGEVPA